MNRDKKEPVLSCHDLRFTIYGFSRVHVAPPNLLLRPVDEDAEGEQATDGDIGEHFLHAPRAAEDDERVERDERDAELRRAEPHVADAELLGRREGEERVDHETAEDREEEEEVALRGGRQD